MASVRPAFPERPKRSSNRDAARRKGDWLEHAPTITNGFVHEGLLTQLSCGISLDLGYLTVQAAAQLHRGQLKADSTSINGGRLGEIQIRDGSILLGEPFVFTKENIDQFDF